MSITIPTNIVKSTPLNENDVTKSGPYLTFKDIEDGLGLSIEVENLGDTQAENVQIKILIENGLFIFPKSKTFHIQSIPAGKSEIVKLKIFGLGLGLFKEIPDISISLNSTETTTRSKNVIARIFGRFTKKVGEYWSSDEAFEGYTLYSPMVSTKSYLINNSGDVVHDWSNDYKPALSLYLLEDGNMLRTAFPRVNPRFWGGGLGGRVEKIDWNGTVLWYFEYTNSQHCLHHDVEYLPNGNVLMISWEYKSLTEAIQTGRDPSHIPMGEVWPDHIIEVEPTGSSGGNIVWEWHAWDHLIQDFDPTKDNYGVIEEHPELIDINFGNTVIADWLHVNSIDYNEEFDQIIINSPNFGEFWIIDHSTTTEEAAGHTGGNSGKGGDLLYRWGNPQAYGRGAQDDQQLFHQHDAQWIEDGCPGQGNILVFNNGWNRPDGDYSSVEEITPPVDSYGNYYLEADNAYGPEDPTWFYMAENPTDFFALNVAGAQRLPNGNTLICDGPHGKFFEVTYEKEIVWGYLNQEPSLIDNNVFKIRKYSPDYPGLSHLFD